MFRNYCSYQNSQGEYLRALRERPAKESQDVCVVLCHGRSVDKDELGGFLALSDGLIQAGYDVFRFDFRGHGQSDGDFFTIDSQKEDIHMTLDYLTHTKKYQSFVIVAASFSGAATLYAVNQSDKKILGLILRNGVVDFAYMTNPCTLILKDKQEQRTKDINEQGRSHGGRRTKISAECYHQTMTYTPQKELARLAIPVVMIHGDADQRVPYEISKKYADLYDHIKLITIIGGTHGFISGPPHILQQAVDAGVQNIKKFMKPPKNYE